MHLLLRSTLAAAALALAGGSVAAGQLQIVREVVVDRPPATVWKLLGDYNALDVWLPPVHASTLASSTAHDGVTMPGALRVLDLGGDRRVTEKLVAYSGRERRYSTTFVESSLPVRNVVATIELGARPDGKTAVRWRATFDAHGADDAQATRALLALYDAGLARLAALFRAQTRNTSNE